MEDKAKFINVLLVDDDQEDVDLMLEVMEMTKMKLNVDVANDGVEAMELLKKQVGENKDKLPDIVLLDLNMPRKNGHEVLKELKADEHLRHIPVVVLTTSRSDADINSTYMQGVSCYITKPLGLSEFQKVVEAINNFWFTVVKYPVK